MKKVFVFAGEPSGDLHGSHLIEALKDHYQIEGVAGPLMRKEGIVSFMQMEDFAVMGFSDVFLSLPNLIQKFYKILNHILKTKPDAVILIDYPGFNLRLADHLRKKGYSGKIIQYISPTVWAHGKERIEKMAKTLDLLLTIYPFEKDYFADTDLRVEYVGHPACQEIESHVYSELDIASPVIAIFPGSREGEIKRNLPKILEAAAKIKQQEPDTVFAISVANEKVKPLIRELLAGAEKNFIFVPKEKTYELMRCCRSAIAKSGTVTLELALHQKPTIVVYELSTLNRFIAKYLMKVNLPFYCIVNIVGGKEIFPELIEKGFTADILSQKVLEITKDGAKREECIRECGKVKALLQEGNASEKAAHAIMQVVS